MTNEAELRAAVGQTKEAFERIDILVNNVGVMLLGNIEGADGEPQNLPLVGTR